jgi:capsular polysaccharide biosynthesis protein
MSWWKYLLIIAMVIAFIGALAIPGMRNYFDLPLPDPRDIASAIGIGVIGAAIIEIGWRMTDWSLPQPASTD